MATYEEGYKQGVIDATVFAPLDEVCHFSTTTDLLADRRKKLLTKKVTKWVNVYQVGEVFGPGDWLYGSKEEAEAKLHQERPLTKRVGTYPIEIEVPL